MNDTEVRNELILKRVKDKLGIKDESKSKEKKS